MSNVTDRGVIDITIEEDNKYVLIIIDTLEWKFSNRQEHVKILQDKINDYLDYIVSGQASEAKPNLRPTIRIIAQYSYSQYCINFLEEVKKFIKEKGDICDIEWKHNEDEIFNDGFSDDYVFKSEKIYPRLKKNWAENPLKDVSFMAASNDLADYPSDLIMIRYMESYIGLFMADVGESFTYLTYDMLPEDITVEELEKIAFNNLLNDIEYRWVESKEPGIYGIAAGGDFEAESIMLENIWKEISEKLGDDIIISIPTKDIVFHTKISDKKLTNKMLEMAKEMYDTNLKENEDLIFSKDVFCYYRNENKIVISDKYKLDSNL